MKSRSVMMLNDQQGVVLSKEERKATLGGIETEVCYVVCKGSRWRISDCSQWSIKDICGEEIPKCCGCMGDCYE